jgi:type IV pilus assembly protein PilF
MVRWAPAILVSATLVGCHREREAPGAAEARIRDANLRFFQARAVRDPRGALDLARVASLMNERARVTGSVSGFEAAEISARRSLANRRANPPALRALAGSLLGRHRFVEALEVADELVAQDSGDVPARALAAQIRMELGRYDEARVAFAGLASHSQHLVVAPSLARWAELTGELDRAHGLLVAARRQADTTFAIGAGTRAWFALQVGGMALRYGRLREARRALQDGLALAPDDPRLLETLARVEARQGRWAHVERLATRALGAGGTDPGLLLLLASAADGRGDSGRAKLLLDRAEDEALRSPGPVHRDVALGLLDRGRAVPVLLLRVQEDLVERPDVYGWDAWAWALRAAGRTDQARAAMRRALVLGTPDPLFAQHAAALGLVPPQTR